jgi:hypothetical protein
VCAVSSVRHMQRQLTCPLGPPVLNA